MVTDMLGEDPFDPGESGFVELFLFLDRVPRSEPQRLRLSVLERTNSSF